jgi:hypothetical protein
LIPDDLIQQGYISKRKHPEEDLYIFNYTPKTQYEGFWNEHTLSARGLITDGDGRIRARCLPKFFNYEQVRSEVSERMSSGAGFEVFEKMDGSLGITYWIGDTPFVSTRGSFESDQALRATRILHERFRGCLRKDTTYLFEIIYPENSICVDYGDMEDLIFLTAFDIDSGEEIRRLDHPFRTADSFDFDCGFDDLKAMNLKNKEGFVVRFDDGFRFKIKFEDYIRLHTLIFSVSSRSVWDALRSGSELALDDLPDEIYGWVKKTKEDILARRIFVENESLRAFDSIRHLPRKEFARQALQTGYSSVLFKMFDNRPYSDIIWKLIDHEHTTPKNEKIQEDIEG